MAATPTRRKGWELFAHPAQQNQRRYEALRAYLYEGASLAQAAARFGYTPATLETLARDLRAGKLALFTPPGKPGRKHAPKKDRARARVLQLRRDGLSVYEISTRLAVEGIGLNRTGVGQILAEEGFGRLLRDPAEQASTSPATSGRDTRLPTTSVLDFGAFPQRVHTAMAGLLLTIPDLVALDLPALVRSAGYPATKPVPAISYLLSLLALKLTGTRRVSHVDDLLGDPAAGLFAGLGVLPKKTALTDYSYRLAHHQQRAFLAALDAQMTAAGLATSSEAVFDLDFHAVMVWASHCSFADCGGQNRPVWAGGGSIRRPFARPVRTWTACSSPRLTRCNRVWRETPWARMASRTGSHPAGASSVNRPRSWAVMRIRQGAPGVSCSAGMNPSLIQRCRVEGASPSWLAASATVSRSPSGGWSLGW